jgi:hypothetical protein
MNIVSRRTICAFKRTSANITLIWAEIAGHMVRILKVFIFTLVYTHYAFVKKFSWVTSRASYFEFIGALEALRMAGKA